MIDPLFPPTPIERLIAVNALVVEERKHRVHMLKKHGEDDAGQYRYWSKRVAQCDEALAHLAVLTEKVQS